MAQFSIFDNQMMQNIDSSPTNLQHKNNQSNNTDMNKEAAVDGGSPVSKKRIGKSDSSTI